MTDQHLLRPTVRLEAIRLEELRTDTPALARQTFLASAGSSLPPAPVVEAGIAHLRLEAEVGGYWAAQQARERSEAVYASVARLIGAAPDEIALTESATRAWQMGFYALPWRAGDRILTGRAEYGANFVAFLQIARRHGVTIDIIPDDASGATDPQALSSMLDRRVRLIALTWMPSNGGLINPAARVGAIARQAGIPYLLDACQAVGQVPVDVEALGCDMLCATGRKFLRGPRGTGFLYVRRGLMQGLEPPMIDHAGAPWTAADRYALRPDARRFEAFESSIAARLGLGVAVDYALDIGLEAIAARNAMLGSRLRAGLSVLPGAQVLDLGREHSAIVSFRLAGQEAAAFIDRAARAGVTIGAVSPGSTLLDAQARSLGTILRASPHYFNTEAEINRLLDLCC